MAKGRKHGGSNHERFLGSAGTGYGHDQGPDLVEEDVWSTMAAGGGGDEDEDGDDDARSDWSYATRGNSGGGTRVRDMSGTVSRTRRWLGREDRRSPGGLSLAFDESNGSPPRVLHQLRNIDNHQPGSHRRGHVASSAPVSVPDWPKILRVDSDELLQRATAAADADAGDDEEWLPPHEYLARESAASGKMVATSVFEGVGRTLKGRDMSRVRNAVWRQTGFFG